MNQFINPSCSCHLLLPLSTLTLLRTTIPVCLCFIRWWFVNPLLKRAFKPFQTCFQPTEWSSRAPQCTCRRRTGQRQPRRPQQRMPSSRSCTPPCRSTRRNERVSCWCIPIDNCSSSSSSWRRLMQRVMVVVVVQSVTQANPQDLSSRMWRSTRQLQ